MLSQGLPQGAVPKLERPGPLRDRVYEALLELITTRALQPGQHLVGHDPPVGVPPGPHVQRAYPRRVRGHRRPHRPLHLPTVPPAGGGVHRVARPCGPRADAPDRASALDLNRG